MGRSSFLNNTHLWLPSYFRQRCLGDKSVWQWSQRERHILFTICDHFEPFWDKADLKKAQSRIERWVKNYPRVVSRSRDCLGNSPRCSFFYPLEQYDRNLVGILADFCRSGYGEVEMHLHHDNDNSESLRNRLVWFRETLIEEHGLLSFSRLSRKIKYGFIHGNWALDNSRRDGRYCGVNDEINILAETGCYADFTMPSAPSETQTRSVNSIYYAIDDPVKPKSHNDGRSAVAGLVGQKGLLCIQGPLSLNFRSRKYGLLPRIENGSLSGDNLITRDRIDRWIHKHIHVKGRPDVVFVKVYTHGAQETIMESFFRKGELERLYSELEELCSARKYRLYYVSPRQMYNVVKGLESEPDSEVRDLLDYELILQGNQ